MKILGGPGGATNDPDFINGLYPGYYCVTVTDMGAPGCTADSCITLNPPPLLMASIAVANVSCYGGNDGAITIGSLQNVPGVPGGTTTIIYDWNWLNMPGNEDYGGSGPNR